MVERILAFIPAYKCEAQIGRVLRQFTPELASVFGQILILDNGSPDKTVERAKEAAGQIAFPVTLIKNDQNYSLGGSIKRAFLFALENNFDYVVTIHGDDQANIADVVREIKKGRHRTHDFLVGARFHPVSELIGYSRFRIFGNCVLNVLCSIIARRKIYDMIAGLNCYKIDFVRPLFFLNFPNDLTFDAHFLLYAIYKSANFAYFPLVWREEDQISNAKVFHQAFIVLKLFAAYMFMPRAALFAENKTRFDKDFRYPGTVIYKKP